MPIKAEHDEKSTPVVYAVEKDGKSIFYANGTSELCEESMNTLRRRKKPFDVISLDCTAAFRDITYIGHLNLKRCINVKTQLLNDGIADKNTVFVLNHFSHNGNAVYDDFHILPAKTDFWYHMTVWSLSFNLICDGVTEIMKQWQSYICNCLIIMS